MENSKMRDKGIIKASLKEEQELSGRTHRKCVEMEGLHLCDVCG